MDKEVVEVLFDGHVIRIVADSAIPVFRVVRALKEDGHDPQVRYHDDELEDFTCWMPTRKAA
jgi:hypothetical protein